jgi:hypothetical protein
MATIMNSQFLVIWFNWDNDPNLTLLTEAEWEALRRPRGIPIGSTTLLPRFSATGELSDIIDFGPPIMVSEKVRAVIARFGGNVEFVPVEIEQDGMKKSYYILNVLHQCDCLDLAASGAVIQYGIIFSFERLCLLEDRTDDVPIFLLPENGQHVIFLRQDVVDELQRVGCTGVSFIPPEECRMGM